VLPADEPVVYATAAVPAVPAATVREAGEGVHPDGIAVPEHAAVRVYVVELVPGFCTLKESLSVRLGRRTFAAPSGVTATKYVFVTL